VLLGTVMTAESKGVLAGEVAATGAPLWTLTSPLLPPIVRLPPELNKPPPGAVAAKNPKEMKDGEPAVPEPRTVGSPAGMVVPASRGTRVLTIGVPSPVARSYPGRAENQPGLPSL